MTTTIPTPPISFIPFLLAPNAAPSPGAEPAAPAARRPLLPAAKAPSNDDVERVPPLDDTSYQRLLADPRVRASLWARVGPVKMPRPDKEDLVGQVLEILWLRRANDDPARTLPRILGLARTIADGKLVDYWRHKEVVDEDIVDAPRSHDDDAPLHDGQPTYVEELRPPRSFLADDALDAKQRMQYVNEVAAKIGLTDEDVEDMFALTYDAEASYEELAAERGMTPGALRTRLHRLQKAVSEGWARKVKRTLILTLLLLAMLLLYALAAIGPARNPPPPAPRPEPTVQEVAPVAPTATATAMESVDVDPGRKPGGR